MDGCETLEIYEGFGETTSTCEGFYDGRIYGIPEGYTVYQNMFYVSEYLPILASKLNLCCICDPDSNKKFEGEQLKEKGKSRKVKVNY